MIFYAHTHSIPAQPDDLRRAEAAETAPKVISTSSLRPVVFALHTASARNSYFATTSSRRRTSYCFRHIQTQHGHWPLLIFRCMRLPFPSSLYPRLVLSPPTSSPAHAITGPDWIRSALSAHCIVSRRRLLRWFADVRCSLCRHAAPPDQTPSESSAA
jgi:hypothetical protein